MPTDFYNIESALSEEERAVRDTIRTFVDEKVLPIIGDCYIEGRFPRELIPQMAHLGMFGANLPEEYGCAGLNNVSYGLIMQELERGDSGVRSFASVQGALVGRHIRRDGWAEALHTLLHEMVHQWQDEQGLPVDHGSTFRAKARAVGITPLACRAVA